MPTTFADLDATDPEPVEVLVEEVEEELVPVVVRFLKDRPRRFEDVTDNAVGQCPTSERSACRVEGKVDVIEPIFPPAALDEDEPPEIDAKAVADALVVAAAEIPIQTPEVPEETSATSETSPEDSAAPIDQEAVKSEEAPLRRRRRRG